MNDEVPKLFDSLAARLCERKALKPLYHFLSAYFAINGLTDGWHSSYEELRLLRAMCRDQLAPDELRDVNTLINRIGRGLDRHVWLEDVKEDICKLLPENLKRDKMKDDRGDGG